MNGGLCWLGIACALAVVRPAAAVQRGDALITVERTAPGSWRTTYRLPSPTTTLRFARRANFYRERVWTVETPGYHLGRSGDWQVAALDSGATPQSTIVFTFPQFTETIPKEYELFQPFTDGAVALYTGHFYVTPEGPAYRDTTELRTLRIVPPAGAHTIVRGRVLQGTVTVPDSVGDGTYVYLGSATPIETPDLVAIVDPGMPAWLGELFTRRLPELFAAYTSHFGTPLPWKPVVLYSFNDTAISGYNSGGGTLTGLINMTLTGSAWRTPNPEATEQAFHLLAHESAHLWNGQLVQAEGGGGSWMHEGGAEAMANDMLLAFGIIDSTRHRANQETALNRCAASAARGPLNEAGTRGDFRDYYECGVVMALWTEGLVRRGDERRSLFSFWRDLVAAARNAGGRYDQTLYFSVLRHDGASPGAVDSMRSFVTSTNAFDVALRGLGAAGVRVAPSEGAPPPAFQQDLARRAFAHLMTVQCRRTNFYSGAPIVTGIVPGCEPFTRELRVDQVAGFRVRDQGAALYDAVLARCGAGGSVDLEDDTGDTIGAVTCDRPLAPRPPWYVLH
jgi:hypothetical protein